MDLLEALRDLTSLDSPRRRPVPGVKPARPEYPWAEIAEKVVAHGLAPLVAYSMEYRLGGAGAPPEIHDTLLGYYHGALTDNVYKLVQLRKLLSEAAEAPVVMLEAVAYADALYPHVAFRPLPEIHLLVRRGDFQKLALAGAPLEMKLEVGEDGTTVLTDGRTPFILHDAILQDVRGSEDEAIWSRGVVAKAFGPLVRRPSLEDALLSQVALLSRAGFAAPLVSYVDLREIVRGSPSQGSTWDRVPDAAAVKARAAALGLSRALWCALELLTHFFPEAREAAGPLTPEISAPVRAVLEAGIVLPSKNLERTRVNRAAEEIRKMLS